MAPYWREMLTANTLHWDSKLTWNANSLVGVRTSPNIPYGSSLSLFKMGSAKARVFPLPVFAQPMQSSPFKTWGMQFCWMGVGFLTPETHGKRGYNKQIYITFKIYFCTTMTVHQSCQDLQEIFKVLKKFTNNIVRQN